MLIDRLKKDGWIATEYDGKIVMTHSELVCEYTIAEAIKQQEFFDLHNPSPASADERVEEKECAH